MRGNVYTLNHPLFYAMIKKTVCKLCPNELIMELSEATGLCSLHRENMYPKHLPDTQWDNYWKLYMEKNNVK